MKEMFLAEQLGIDWPTGLLCLVGRVFIAVICLTLFGAGCGSYN